VSTRDLRVRFVGDASGLKGAFSEVNAAAATAGTGLRGADQNVNAVGKSFTKTGKLFKATGKVFRSSGLDALSASSAFASSIPALAGVSSGLGAATIAGEGLLSVAGTLGGFALPALGVAAIAAAGAYAFLHNDVSSATDALRQMEAENQRVKDSHVQVARAALAQKAAVEGVEDAQMAQRQSSLNLWQANHDLAEIAKENGKNSLAYRQALLNVRQAEESVADARRASINSAQEVIRTTERRKKVTDEETAAVRRQAAEARKVALGLNLGLIAGKDREAASKKVSQALEAESKALNKSQARHKANAAAARDAAAAMKGDASPAAQQLRQKLMELARTEVDMAQVISAMMALGNAAGFAKSQVLAAAAAIRSMPTTIQAPRVVGGGGGSGVGARARGLFNQDAAGGGLNFALARVPIGSPTDLARTRGRGDRNERTAALNAEGAARKAGKSEEQIRIAGERAAAKVRQKNLLTIAGKIRARRKKLVVVVKKFDITARMKVKVPGPRFPDKRTAALTRRLDMKAREEDIRNELESLAADYADAQVQLAELGADLADLDRQDEAESAAIAEAAAGGGALGGEGPPTQGDFLDAAAAEATLSPGLDDDVAAAEAIELAAHHAYNAAKASGDPRQVADAASALFQARQNLEQLRATRDNTDALNANTAAVQGFGGSSTFSYRGQDYTLRSLAPPSSDRLVEATI
jgi:hypothetical protein